MTYPHPIAPTRVPAAGRRITATSIRSLVLVVLAGAVALMVTGHAHAQPPPTPPPLPLPTGQAPVPGELPGQRPAEPWTVPLLPPSEVPVVPPGPDDPLPPGWVKPEPVDPECAGWQIGCELIDAIHQWFVDLAADATMPSLDMVSDSLLQVPELTTVEQVRDLWEINRWIANTVFVLFIVAGGIVIASHETLQTRFSAREVLPRIVTGFVAVNANLPVIGQSITATNTLVKAVLGEKTMGGVATHIKTTIEGSLRQDALFAVGVALFVLVLIIVLVAGYVVRVALTIIVVAAGPLALACHASPYSEGIAKLWWRMLLVVLAIPLLQSLTLVVFVDLFFGPSHPDMLHVGGSLMGLLVSVVLFGIMIKIPKWLRQQVGLGGRSAIASIVKVALLAKGLSLLTGGRLGRAGLHRGAAASRRSGAGKAGMSWSDVFGTPEWFRTRLTDTPDDPEPGGFRRWQQPHLQRWTEKRARVAGQAREAAIRAWSKPQATVPRRTSSTPERLSTPAQRQGSTPSRISRTPQRMSTPATSTAVTPPRGSAPPPPTAFTPPSAAITPDALGKTPAAAQPAPPLEHTQRRRGRRTSSPDAAAYIPPRISSPTPPMAMRPTRISSTPPSGGIPERISGEPPRISQTPKPTGTVRPAESMLDSPTHRVRRRATRRADQAMPPAQSKSQSRKRKE
ncbi:hypothetical protein ACWEV3_40305 [Saccharopolyspora sp. NPDC003752]